MTNPDKPAGGTGPTGTRSEVGNSATSQAHPPHVTENDENAPVQREGIEAPNEAPALPANASGTDAVSADEQMQPIEPTSMYERRPAENKDLHVDGTDPNTR